MYIRALRVKLPIVTKLCMSLTWSVHVANSGSFGRHRWTKRGQQKFGRHVSSLAHGYWKKDIKFEVKCN